MTITITPAYRQVQVVQNQNHVLQVSAQGPIGQGVPTGGTAGQFLIKNSGTDYDTIWDTLDAAQIPTLTLSKISDAGTMAAQNANAVTITGGTINGATIGATTPSSGIFTTLQANGNTTLGDASGDILTINGTAVTTPNGLNFDSNTLVIDAANNRVGIGTSAPSDLLHLDGPNASTSGPRIAITTAADIYPVFQVMTYTHDNSGFIFDAYWNGSWRSSHAGSNFGIYKYQDNLRFQYAAGVAQGSGLTWNEGLSINSAGRVGIGLINAGARLQVNVGVAFTIGQIIKAAASQTANLQEWQDSSANILSFVAASGAATFGRLDAGTNDTQTALTVRRNSTNTPAANFASRLLWQLESSTTADQDAAGIVTSWVVATHASRTARQVFNIYDTAAREAMRLEASGSAPMIGFLGANAAVRQTGGALTAGATYGANEQTMLQRVFDMARTFGLMD